MTYVLLYFQILFYTLGVLVICGLAVGVCGKLFQLLMGQGFGRGLVIATSIIGTPVHELGHALMCLLFGHKIEEIALWRPLNDNGEIGYVTHRYRPKNLYHQLGNLFIGLGPVFSGLLVMLLAMMICFPATLHGYADTATALVSSGAGTIPLVKAGLSMIPDMIREFSDDAVPLWGRVLGLLVMLSVSLHISLSPADVKGALGGVPVYLVLVLVATVIPALMGAAAMSAVVSALQWFSAAALALFMLVLLFALVQLALGAVVFLIRLLFGLR